MDTNDRIYLKILTFSILFGLIYRKIENRRLKKHIGTCVGLIIVYSVSGVHMIHSIVTFLVHSTIILKLPRTKCQTVSAIFSFLYLLFFRMASCFGLAKPTPQANLVQMILTLKLVGLAGESQDNERLEVGFYDIFHYTFNYVGLLTGPYYRYQTFQDFIDLKFWKIAKWQSRTVKKLIQASIFSLVFLILSTRWPLSYISSEDFSIKSSLLYRLFYAFPVSLSTHFRLLAGLTLSESICLTAGLGAYPSFTNPKPGIGPTEKHEQLTTKSNINYNFNTIKTCFIIKSLFSKRIRDNIKFWNMPVQYWFYANIYKNFKFKEKTLKFLLTISVSSFWHGLGFGYYIFGLLMVIQVIFEDFLYKSAPQVSIIKDIVGVAALANSLKFGNIMDTMLYGFEAS